MKMGERASLSFTSSSLATLAQTLSTLGLVRDSSSPKAEPIGIHLRFPPRPNPLLQVSKPSVSPPRGTAPQVTPSRDTPPRLGPASPAFLLPQTLLLPSAGSGSTHSEPASSRAPSRIVPEATPLVPGEMDPCTCSEPRAVRGSFPRRTSEPYIRRAPPPGPQLATKEASAPSLCAHRSPGRTVPPDFTRRDNCRGDRRKAAGAPRPGSAPRSAGPPRRPRSRCPARVAGAALRMRLWLPRHPLGLPVWKLDWEAGEPGLEPDPDWVRLAGGQRCERVER